MKILTNAMNPNERDYDPHASLEARVTADRIWFDEGYREADKGETVKLSPEDFDALEVAGQVEPEQVAADRDKRAAARAEKTQGAQ